MDLEDLDFSPIEVFSCEAHDGRLLIPAMIDGHATLLLLDTGSRSDILLDAEYAGKRGFTIDGTQVRRSTISGRPRSEYGITTLDHASLLGRTLREKQVYVADLQDVLCEGTGNVAGILGSGFFCNGILAVDARSRRVGFSEGDAVRNSFPEMKHRLKLLGLTGGCVPTTGDLQEFTLFGGKGESPVLLLNSGSRESYLTLDYVFQKRGWGYHILQWKCRRAFQRSKGVFWYVQMPGEEQVQIHFGMLSSLRPYAQSLGLERIDGMLGMNFLSRWITVFDFPASYVDLLEYQSV